MLAVDGLTSRVTPAKLSKHEGASPKLDRPARAGIIANPVECGDLARGTQHRLQNWSWNHGRKKTTPICPRWRCTRLQQLERRLTVRAAGVRSEIKTRDVAPRFRRAGRRRAGGSGGGPRPGCYVQNTGSLLKILGSR